MKWVITGLMAGAIGFMTGCSSLHESKVSAPVDADSKVVLVTPDVEIGDKIQGEAEITYIFGGLITLGANKFVDGVSYNSAYYGMFDIEAWKEVKGAAAYNACKKSGADIIISPNYEVERNNYLIWNTYKATVTGFKATIKKIQPQVEYRDLLEYKDYFLNIKR